MKRRFSKVLSVILCLFLLTATASVAFAAGSVADIVISDAAGLAALAEDPAAYAGKTIVLDQNIDASEIEELVPIGTEDVPFSGRFDGQGHTIDGIDFYGEDNYAGLFGYVKDAVITDFVIANAEYQHAFYNYANFAYVGAVVGYADHSTISKITTVDTKMSTGANAGGIAGTIVNGSVVEDCVSGSAVTVNAGSNGGGIVGEVVNSEVNRCINTAAVKGANQKNVKNVAGIAGKVTDGTVSHCLNSGAVSSSILTQTAGTSSGVAGIVGLVAGTSTVAFCGNAGTVNCTTDCSGVIASVSGSATVSFCYNAGATTCGGNYKDSSYAVAPAAAVIENCVAVSDTVTADAMKSADAYEGWDFDAVWYTPGNYHGYAYPVLRDCNFHSMEKEVTAPTCTSDGVTVYTCSDMTCGFSYFEEGEKALGHDYSILVSTKEANCTYEGEKTYKCSRCQQENPEKEILPVDPDKHVDENQDNICDICEKTIKEEEVKKSFFQRVIDFFKRIFDWIKRLFTGQL